MNTGIFIQDKCCKNEIKNIDISKDLGQKTKQSNKKSKSIYIESNNAHNNNKIK